MNERPVDQTTPRQQATATAQTAAEDRTAAPQQARVERGQIDDSGFLPDDRMDSLRDRWDDVQAGFVDDPQSAVQKGHQLVAELVDELTQTFTRERTNLESQWNGGGTADTEQLRIALQRYRSFFNRLLGT